MEIKDVESFAANLDSQAFADGEGFGDAEVQVGIAEAA